MAVRVLVVTVREVHAARLIFFDLSTVFGGGAASAAKCLPYKLKQKIIEYKLVHIQDIKEVVYLGNKIGIFI